MTDISPRRHSRVTLFVGVPPFRRKCLPVLQRREEAVANVTELSMRPALAEASRPLPPEGRDSGWVPPMTRSCRRARASGIAQEPFVEPECPEPIVSRTYRSRQVQAVRSVCKPELHPGDAAPGRVRIAVTDQPDVARSESLGVVSLVVVAPTRTGPVEYRPTDCCGQRQRPR